MSILDTFTSAARRLLNLDGPSTMSSVTFVSVSQKQPGTPDPTEGDMVYNNPTSLVPYDATRITTYDRAEARKVGEGLYSVYAIQTVVTPVGNVGDKRVNTTEKLLAETAQTQQAAAAVLKIFEEDLSKQPDHKVVEGPASTKRYYGKYAPKAA